VADKSFRILFLCSGGSSCANVLAQSGQRVLLLEQHEERTGGCTHTFRIENCEWDTGKSRTCAVCAVHAIRLT